MKRYDLYAGINGESEYQGTEEFNDLAEALVAAYNIAIEIYESYEGSHGVMSWGDCRDDLEESYPDLIFTSEDVDAHYQSMIEETIEFNAILSSYKPESC